MTNSRNGKVVLAGAALAICALLLIGAVDGRIVLEKIALRLLTPLGLIWMALFFQTAWAFRHGRRGAGIWSMALLLTLTLLGNGPMTGALIARLERPYAQIDPLSEPKFDAAIVLGGGSTDGQLSRPELNEAGDRLLLAAQMHHAGKADRLICTGRRIDQLSPDGLDPAEQSRRILVSLGIPDSAIELSGGRNTSEEFQQLADVIQPGERVGLLTSAWHMPRAERLAAANGLTVSPVPSDFRGSHVEDRSHPWSPGSTVMSIIPSAEAMAQLGVLWKEWLATVVGR